MRQNTDLIVEEVKLGPVVGGSSDYSYGICNESAEYTMKDVNRVTLSR